MLYFQLKQNLKSEMFIDYGKEWETNDLGSCCQSGTVQDMCSWWVPGVMNFCSLLPIAAAECLSSNAVFSEVTELAKIAHEVIFYLNGVHSLE